MRKSISIIFLLLGVALQAQDCSRYKIFDLQDSTDQWGTSGVFFRMTIDSTLLQNTGYTDLFFVDQFNDTITTYGNWGFLIPQTLTLWGDTIKYHIPYNSGVTSFPANFIGNLVMRNPECNVPYNHAAIGIKQFELKDLNIYPNPAQSNGLIRWNSKDKIQSIVLMDLNGKLLLQTEINSQEFSLPELNPGLYILRLSDGILDEHVRLVVQ